MTPERVPQAAAVPVTEVPPALVDKYRTRAPRYTSYPTAPHFGTIAPAAVDAALAKGTGPTSLYVHIPFCKTLCLYCGCHVEIQGKREIGAVYVDGLLAELDLIMARLQPGRGLAQLALGGGTPTFLRPDDMARLIEGIRARLPFTETVDAAIEIDPRTVDVDYLHRLVDLGFNRYSFGVQDFDPAVLEAVHRRQGEDMVWRAVETLRSRGSFDLNLDLMYGLPHQTPTSFERTVAIVAEMRPTRIALFHYAHVPWMKPAQKLLERGGEHGVLPDSATKSILFRVAEQGLGAAGYLPIGMDHFALPGDELVKAWEERTLQRNFMGYTTRAGLDQMGIGVSAIGSFGGIYAQDIKERGPWAEEIEAGRLPIARGLVLSPADLLRRTVIMDLFCNFRVRWGTDVDFSAELARLSPMAEDGLCVLQPDGVDVTPLGRHFIRNVCAVFDQYLEADLAARRYSQTA